MASREDTVIDFTVEPGIVKRGSTNVSGDAQWAQSPGPLMRQIQEFFSSLNRKTPKRAAEALLGSVAVVQRCDELLKQHQRKWSGTRSPLRPTRAASARLYEQTQAAPGDAQALEDWVVSVLRSHIEATLLIHSPHVCNSIRVHYRGLV